eukprot:TRINITY_DN5258_c0_g1_i1.p1 TRINITY_DN5258_c0_g1~~TRINITY_DN5258_c0_g1_i1.p1  ORF type:complete len:426 (-),score=157.80 TRINITY_DN5258_c0_g1_i1:119-1396(-)
MKPAKRTNLASSDSGVPASDDRDDDVELADRIYRDSSRDWPATAATAILAPEPGDADLPLAGSKADKPAAAKAKEAMDWVDLVRVVGCTLVIYGHTITHLTLVHPLPALKGAELVMFSISTALPFCGVPLFFMLSGYLLLPRPQPPVADYYQRRIPRILLPMVVWSLAYYFWDIYFYDNSFSLAELGNKVLTSYLSDHLWFLYVMFYLYLVTPLLSLVVQHGEKSILMLVVGLWFISDPINASFFGNAAELKFQLQGFRGTWIGFYLLGGLSSFYPRFGNKRIGALSIFFLLSLLLLSYTNYIYAYFHNDPPRWDWRFVIQFGAPVTLMSTPLFYMVRHLGQSSWYTSKPSLLRFMKTLADHTYGMYLLHMMVQDVTAYFSISENMYRDTTTWVSVPLFTFVLMLGSFAITYVLKRLPYVGALVG